MEVDDISSDYDVIVVGTGMTESILAAALSRIGKSVLHLDSNEYYGENWASFNFEGIQNWVKKIRTFRSNEVVENATDEVGESEIIYRIRHVLNVDNVLELWHCKKSEVTPNKQIITIDVTNEETETVKIDDVTVEENPVTSEKFEEFCHHESRRFNLDLCPKVLFSRGALVELLISSNIAKYAEFKNISRVLTWRNEILELVPCSRADVFSTKNITVVEKRLLVKNLTLFLKYPENAEEFSGFENKTFVDYLKHKKLPNNLIHYLLYAIAMGDKKTPCLEGVKASKSFLESLGRYGNTPFIFPMYGSGELPQCFCRLCAVFGGVYYLKREIEGIIVKENKCVGIMSRRRRLNAEIFIISSNYIPSELSPGNTENRISRGIFVTDRSILASEKEPLTLLIFPPPAGSESSVTVIELGPGTCACPEKVYVVHMTTAAKADAASDLRHVSEALFRGGDDAPGAKEESERPRVLWSLTWNFCQPSKADDCPENLKICGGPNADLDYNFAIDEAKRIFGEICPDEEFLPRAPDPEEIVLESDEAPEEKEPEREEKSGSGDVAESDAVAAAAAAAAAAAEEKENGGEINVESVLDDKNGKVEDP